MSAQDRIRVLVADPDALARRTVCDALTEGEDIAVVAQAATVRELDELTRYFHPDVVLAELDLPGGDGVALIRQLAQEVPEARVVLLCAREDEEQAFGAIRAGVAGYLTKDLDPSVLPRIVRSVAAGEAAIPRVVVMRMLEWMREVPDAGWRPLRSRLTSREWEMVDLLADGATTDAIAEELFVTPATVYSHVKNLLRKLGVHSRREAVLAAGRLRKEEAAAIGR